MRVQNSSLTISHRTNWTFSQHNLLANLTGYFPRAGIAWGTSDRMARERHSGLA